jgi:LPPG:FO 2-phospho-L-lactate transferase
MYRLAALNDPERGWGLAGETWAFMAALERIGGETWFRLGDTDLATHIERTRRLAAGETLSQVTAALCTRLAIAHPVAPMSDDPVRTLVGTADGALAFQDYFVRLACAPAVTGFDFPGAARALPSPALAAALADPGLLAIIVCPSNPFVSIGPILALPAVGRALAARRVPAVAVSPIIGGDAVKGPAAKMMRELGLLPSAAGIAAHYGERIDGIVIDEQDRGLAGAIERTGIAVGILPTLMRGPDDERALAEATLDFAAGLGPRNR